VDGLEYTHDLIVEREGVFKECVEGIKLAKLLNGRLDHLFHETRVGDVCDKGEGLASCFTDLFGNPLA